MALPRIMSGRVPTGLIATAIASGVLGAAGLSAQSSGNEQARSHREDVLVERVIVDAHVVDRFSRPIPGLAASDFQVAVDGVPVELESAEWVGPGEAPFALAAEASSPVSTSEHGRQIVILFQWELAAQKATGFVRMLRQAMEFVRRIGPEDRVALVLYDSRLWLRQDFTSDRARLEGVLESILRHEEDRHPESAAGDLLAGLLPEERARHSSSMSEALVELAHALAAVPGEKSLLFFGWGLDTWSPRGLQLVGRRSVAQDPELVRQAMARAKTTVFSIDVSDGSHRLGGGLEWIALATGGLYMESYDFPRFAMGAVEQALSGRYVLVFRKPAGPRGEHHIQVVLKSGKGTVLHRQSYDDGRAE